MQAQTNLGAVQIVNSHFGLGYSERSLEAKLLIGPAWLGSVPPDEPAILLGDFNSVRTSRAYRVLETHLRDVRTLVRSRRPFRTFPTRFPSLAVDHIFVNAALFPTHLNVHRTPLARLASDHFPLVCELTLTKQWSERDERHGRLSREVAVERSGSCRDPMELLGKATSNAEPTR